MDVLKKVRGRLATPLPKEIAKILIICKIAGLLCCISGTIVLGFLPSSFLGCCVIGFIIPGFMCGYMIVNLIGAITNYFNVELIADIVFTTIGICANLYISIEIVTNWVMWYSHDTDSSHISHYGTEFLILAAICLLNVAAMTVQLVYCSYGCYQQFCPKSETSPEPENAEE